MNYIVFDCETGGLDPIANPILEIALVALNSDLKEIGRFETLIRPYDDLIITPEALKANGLKMREVEKGITKKEAVEVITEFFLKHRVNNRQQGLPVAVGHNIPFDIDFVANLLKGSKKEFHQIRNRGFCDTLVDSRRAWPKAAKHNLGSCCEMAGIELINAHRAMADTLATAELFKYHTLRLRSAISKSSNDKKKEEKPRNKFQF